MPSDESFTRMEKLCATPQRRPRILLNDSPMNITINKTILNQSQDHRKLYRSRSDSSICGLDYSLDVLDDSVMNVNRIRTDFGLMSQSGMNHFKSLNTSFISLRDIQSTAHFPDQKCHQWKSYDDQLATKLDCSFDLPHIVTESSAYFSGQFSDESVCPLRDTMDMCNYRRALPHWIGSEPSTPAKIKSPAKKLDLLEANRSTRAIGLVTSSPIKMHESNHFSDLSNNYAEPDNLNNTLDRVNYRLHVCGFVTPSPTRMTKRKHLMQEYVALLLKNNKSSKKLPLGKTFKRTISVDQLIRK